MKPVTMDAQTLAALLHDMGDHVEMCDSWAGTINYEITDGPETTYEVTGLYRTGNSTHGQGFMRVIGEADKVAEE